MSFIARATSRIAAQSASKLMSRAVINTPVTASIRNFTKLTQSSLLQKISNCHIGCSCCNRSLHTKGDQQLVSFLQEEIFEEKKNLVPKVPASLDDFSIKADKAHIHLHRKFNDEEININLYINHSVDAVNDEATVSGEEGQESVQLSSKPDFEVDVSVGTKVMSFSCAYTNAEDQMVEGQEDASEEDVFGITELMISDGEHAENDYAASGDILDENLYGLMMTYLAERGVTEEFVQKLSEMCYEYEHMQYVGLLENVHNFVARK